MSFEIGDSVICKREGLAMDGKIVKKYTRPSPEGCEVTGYAIETSDAILGFVHPDDVMASDQVDEAQAETKTGQQSAGQEPLAKITQIDVLRAEELFGMRAKTPDRMIVRIRTDDGAELVTNLPLGTEYSHGSWTVTDQELNERSFSHPDSKFEAFLRRYQTWPCVGVEVETAVNERGFGKIVVR